MSEEGVPKSERFAIFRKEDAKNYAEHEGIMPLEGVTEVMAEGLRNFAEARDGQTVKMLYSAPGFSLTHVWFKSGYPLPLHAHSSDCLYYILAGSVKMGTEVLGPGDGFFVGKDVPYTYTPGDEGVEVIEFRNTNDFNIRFMGKTKAVWDKVGERVKARVPHWADEVPPSEAEKVS